MVFNVCVAHETQRREEVRSVGSKEGSIEWKVESKKDRDKVDLEMVHGVPDLR